MEQTTIQSGGGAPGVLEVLGVSTTLGNSVQCCMHVFLLTGRTFNHLFLGTDQMIHARSCTATLAIVHYTAASDRVRARLHACLDASACSPPDTSTMGTWLLLLGFSTRPQRQGRTNAVDGRTNALCSALARPEARLLRPSTQRTSHSALPLHEGLVPLPCTSARLLRSKRGASQI